MRRRTKMPSTQCECENYTTKPCPCGKEHCICECDCFDDITEEPRFQSCNRHPCETIGCYYTQSNADALNDPDFKCPVFFDVQYADSEYTDHYCYECVIKLIEENREHWLIRITDLYLINRLYRKQHNRDLIFA